MAHQRRSCPELTKIERIMMRARSFEAGDVDDIPAAYHVSPVELMDPSRVSLHEILWPLIENGAGPHAPVRGDRTLTIADRHETFTDAWKGPPALEMAECGMMMISNDRARCYVCPVTLRGLTPDTSIWSRHRDCAPNCRHLRRASAHGTKASNPGKRVRRFSASDSMGLPA